MAETKTLDILKGAILLEHRGKALDKNHMPMRLNLQKRRSFLPG